MQKYILVAVPGFLLTPGKRFTRTIPEPWFWSEHWSPHCQDVFRMKGNYREDFEKKGIKFPMTEDEADKILFEGQNFREFIEYTTYGSTLSSEGCLDLHGYKPVFRHWKDCVASKNRFIIDIPLGSDIVLENSHRAKFPLELTEAIRRGQGRVVFCQGVEGWLASEENLTFFRNFCHTHNFTKDNVWIFGANLRMKELYEREAIPVTIQENNQFEWDLWFVYHDQHTDLEKIQQHLEERLQANRYQKDKRTFICLNRRNELYRYILATHLKFKYPSKSYVSLGLYPYKDAEDVVQDIKFQIGHKSYYRKLASEVLTTLEKHPEISIMLDDPDPRIDTNHASDICPYQTEAFIPIVTESRFELDSTKVLFFSEKTYRPIYCLQPFILAGNAGSLENLRKKGYKTFSRWWDESYDTIINPGLRLVAILKLIDDLAKLDQDQLFQIYQEMEPTLVHNYNLLMSKVRMIPELQKVYGFGEWKKTRVLV